ncbi:MAG TPA: TolC family protein [Gemmatimonadaceae bacterium]|jgi:cobalt-zinc-cadmium efflux system outer membrane protein
MKLTTTALVVLAHAGTLAAQTTAPPARDSIALTRAAAIGAALARNPQLDMAREQTAQARARRTQAVAIPDPTATASLDDQPGFLQLGQAQSRNVVVGLDLPFPDKFRLRNRIASADVRSAELSVESVRQSLVASTSAAYDTLLVANRHHAIVTMSRDLAADFLKKTQARYEGGTAAKLDVIRAQVALAQAENDLIATARDIQTASDALDRLIGQPIGTPVAALDSLTVPPSIPDVDLLEQQALTARPELASLASQQAGARASTALAREFWLPDFTIGAQRDYGPAGAGTGALYTAGIALPVPIFYWQHSKGEIAESRSRERELAAAYRDLRAEVAQDVRAAYATATAALRQAVYIRDALLPSAREAYRVASVSYGLGGSSALDVLDARQNLLAAELQYADALAAANSSRADLERAVATPLTRFDTQPRRAP